MSYGAALVSAVQTPRLRLIKTPATAPTHCAATKPKALDGAMTAKLSDYIRPITAAGLTNDVRDVNQYAAPM